MSSTHPPYRTTAEQLHDEAVKTVTPLGAKHLHYVHRDGRSGMSTWAVRTRRSPLCGTIRCRMVYIRILEGRLFCGEEKDHCRCEERPEHIGPHACSCGKKWDAIPEHYNAKRQSMPGYREY